ncbi:MAG: BMC domain-containing protein [Rhodothermales bacterium]
MSPVDETALGMLETQGLVAAIEAADAMLKTAYVRLVSMEKTDPALITIYVTGETAAVQASVDAGRAAAERVGKVVSAHVIPRPDPDVRKMVSTAPPPPSSHSDETLDSMTVTELRTFVRDLPDFPIHGRAVARARKEDLIEALRHYRR